MIILLSLFRSFKRDENIPVAIQAVKSSNLFVIVIHNLLLDRLIITKLTERIEEDCTCKLVFSRIEYINLNRSRTKFILLFQSKLREKQKNWHKSDFCQPLSANTDECVIFKKVG